MQDREDTPQPNDPLIQPEVEAALLGAFMIQNSLITTVADQLRQDDFAVPVHGRIYSAMLRFVAKGHNATPVNLRPVFAMDMEAEGGAYLDRLADLSAAVTGASDFAAQVMECASRRRARAAHAAAASAMESDFETTISDISGRAEDVVTAAASRSAVQITYSPVDLIEGAENRVDQIVQTGTPPGAVCRTVSELNKLLGPLEGGHYTIIGARTSIGKTTLALSGAWGYAANGHAGAYYFTEMDGSSIGIKFTADLALGFGFKIKHKSLRDGNLNFDERAALKRVRQGAANLPLVMVPIGRCPIRRLYSLVARRKAMLAAEGRKLEFVVVDHIQHLTAEMNGREIDDSRKRINAVSAGLLHIAQALDVHVVALSQLSRKVEERIDKRPNLSDLKESGDLEQDADNVLLLYREAFYLQANEPKPGTKGVKGEDLREIWEASLGVCERHMDIIAAKVRHGRTMTRQARFFGEYSAVRSGDFDLFNNDDPVLF